MIPQGSPEWRQVRCGKVTASRLGDLMARTKSGWGASRGNYRAELVAERLTGQPYPTFSSPAMRWGTETEPQARAAYSFFTDHVVTEVGFMDHPTIALSGASPDGLVGDTGLVEFKCPNTATHLGTLKGDAIPVEYVHQMQWQMECTGRLWCDWVSFDPRLPPVMQLSIRRVDRDEAALMALRAEVMQFNLDVSDEVAMFRGKYGLKEPA